MVQCGKRQKDVHRGNVCVTSFSRTKITLASLTHNSLSRHCKKEILYVCQNQFKYFLTDDFASLNSLQLRLCHHFVQNHWQYQNIITQISYLTISLSRQEPDRFLYFPYLNFSECLLYELSSYQQSQSLKLTNY